MTAAAMPSPIILTVRSVVRVKAKKTTVMMAAAALMTRPLVAWPIRTARGLSRRLSHSSWIRLTRNTW